MRTFFMDVPDNVILCLEEFGEQLFFKNGSNCIHMIRGKVFHIRPTAVVLSWVPDPRVLARDLKKSGSSLVYSAGLGGRPLPESTA